MRHSLNTKLVLSTSIVLLVAMSLFGYIALQALQRLFLQDAVADAERLSETIIQTTHYQMLEDDRKRVYQMIREVGNQKDVDHIRMINKEGQILFSTDEKEIGTILDKKAAACNMCHANETPLIHASTMNRTRFFTDAGGNRVLGLAKGIYNQESCYMASCHFHSPQAKVLGVLDIIVNLEGTYAVLSSYQYRLEAMIIFLILLIWLSLTLFMHRMVNRPMKQLIQHTRQVAQGNLNSVTTISQHDEMGELASSLNSMTSNLKKARHELEDWGRHLEEKVEERTRELTEVQAQLVRSEKLASLGELVAGIAHEINNPLTGILMYAMLIKQDKRLAPELLDDLETVVRETGRCSSIVQRLLEFSRENPPRKSMTCPNTVIEHALSLIRNQTFFNSITVQLSYDPELPEILIDPNQMEQVFVNILLNGCQAMPEGGTLSVQTGNVAGKDFIFVKVGDTGCGMPPEIVSRIFDPFFTTKENRGTGLGLSVSYGIVQNHGGTIDVETAEGAGTTFTITLPIGQHEPVADAELQEDGCGNTGYAAAT